jgi:hypothetical protein
MPERGFAAGVQPEFVNETERRYLAPLASIEIEAATKLSVLICLFKVILGPIRRE